MSNITIKRIYEEASDKDGYRILIDRIWPRGISIERAKIDEWNKEIAPSTELRKWFDHKEERFSEFSARYREELRSKETELIRIAERSKNQVVTLLYSTKSINTNHAPVLGDVIIALQDQDSHMKTAEPSSPVCFATSKEVREEFRD